MIRPLMLPIAGMRDIFLLIKATRQLRGESCFQVEGTRLAVAYGNGGMLGSRHYTERGTQ